MRVYLDFQATTPLDPEVLEAMLPWLTTPANPHATEHAWGREAEVAVERARDQVATAVGADRAEVIFTAGATEAANLVLQSFAGRRILISAIEHPCVEETAAEYSRNAGEIERIPVDREGLIDLDWLADRLDGADLVSVMAVNNEVGTIQPVDTIATLCRAADVPLHTDAAQAVGRLPSDMLVGASFITLSGHKIYGPQGIGAIVAKPDLMRSLKSLMAGGGQQNGLRPGTIPVALAVGLGEACALASARRDADHDHCADLSRQFLQRLSSERIAFEINGSVEQRVPHNLNVCFGGVSADELLALVPELALSTGSACSSGAVAPSRVLTAMGLDEAAVRGSIRIGFGRTTTSQEVVYAAEAIGAAVRRLRGE